MTSSAIAILLIEDDDEDALLLQKFLTLSGKLSFQVTRVERLGKGLEALDTLVFDIVLLDLGLPDSQGSTPFSRCGSIAPIFRSSC